MGRTITAALGTAGVEEVQDTVATMMTNGGGLTWTYNDPAGTLTPAVAHSGISGLTADDHTQYALLLGRSGGQTLIGGTAASNGLTLSTTSHATKGVFSVDTDHIYKNAAGNIGFNTSDVEAWNSSFRALQLGTHHAIMYGALGNTSIYHLDNLYNDGSAWKYRTTAPGSMIQIGDGTMYYYTVPSGTIDTAATLNERLRITNAGDVGIGVNPATKLHTYSAVVNYLTIQRDNSGTNMEIGGVLFSGGAANTSRAAILAHTPSSDANGSLAFYTQPTAGSLTERLKISNDGNITTTVGAVASNGITINGTSSPRLRVAETGSSVFADLQSDGGAGYVGTNSNHPFVINSASAEAARFNTSRNFGIGTGATVDRRLHIEQDSAATNTVTQVARFTSTSTGTPANGIGVGMEFEVETAAATNKVGATIEAVATDVTGTSEDFALDFKAMAAGAAASTVLRLNGTGNHGINTTDIEAWHASLRAIHLGVTGSICHGASTTTVLINDNAWTDGVWKYRTTGAATSLTLDGGFIFSTAVSGTIDTNVPFTEQMRIAGTGTLGVTVGAPTGGAKGLGTINAVAVYDDNVLLTCYVLDQALDGTISTPKWDAKVPPRVIKGINGNITSSVTRLHEPLRKFAARIGTVYDPLDVDKFWKHIVDKRHLTAYPNETVYDPVNGKQDIGNWQQQTIELLEIYAVHIHKLNERIKALELKP